MPDDIPSRYPLVVKELQRNGFQFHYSPRVSHQHLTKMGFTPGAADKLITSHERMNQRHNLTFGEALLRPVTFVGEIAQSLQKPIIAAAGGIARGEGLLETIGETLKAPFTTRRTFGEIPGLADKIGAGGVLGADLLLDPLFVFSGATKVGKLGRITKFLENTRMQVAGGEILMAIPKGGAKAKQIAGSYPAAQSISEILKQGVKGGGGIRFRLKGNPSRKAARKWLKDVRYNYGEFAKAWQKKFRTTPPSIDDVFAGARGKMPSTGDLIRVGAESLGQIKMPFVDAAAVPFRGTQARIGDWLDAPVIGDRAFDKVNRAAKATLNFGFDSNRVARYTRATRSLTLAKKFATQQSTIKVMEQARARLEEMGILPESAEYQKIMNYIEVQGTAMKGGREAAERGGPAAAGTKQDPTRGLTEQIDMQEALRHLAIQDQAKAHLKGKGGFQSQTTGREINRLLKDFMEKGKIPLRAQGLGPRTTKYALAKAKREAMETIGHVRYNKKGERVLPSTRRAPDYGILTESVDDVRLAHSKLERLDESQVRVVSIDPARAPIDPDLLTSFAEEVRLKRYQRLLEDTMDPKTKRVDPGLALRNLRTEVENSISGLVGHMYGVPKGSSGWRLGRWVEDQFMSIGHAEMAAGALGAAKYGYIPRALTPFAEWLMRDWAQRVGRMKGFGGGQKGMQDFNAFLEHTLHRKFSGLSRIEIEDLFAREGFSTAGFLPAAKEARRYMEQVGAGGKNTNIVKFFDAFSAKGFLRQMARTDRRMTEFFLSDPIAMGAKRWATAMGTLHARDFMTSISKALAIETLEQGKVESTAGFMSRITKLLSHEYDDFRKYRIWMDTTHLPDEMIQKLRASNPMEAGKYIEVPADARSAMFTEPVKHPYAGYHKADALEGLTAAQRVGRTSLGPASQRQRLTAHIMDADHMKRIASQEKIFSDPSQMQGFSRLVEKTLGIWKQWALFPRPDYHFRNFVSNTWLMFQSGMGPTDIMKYYYKAMRLQKMALGHKSLYLDSKIRYYGRGEAIGVQAGKPSKQALMAEPFLTHPNLGPLSGEKVIQDLVNNGVWSTGFMTSESSISIMNELAEQGFKAKAKWWQKGARGVLSPTASNYAIKAGQSVARGIENLSRTAMYLWHLEKKGSSGSVAASEVFTHLFNYDDLMPWERSMRSTMVPFWAWIRNNVPLQLRKTLQQPAKTLLPIRAVQSMKNQLEVSQDLEPEWLSEQLGFPIKIEEDRNGRRQVKYGFMGSFFPISDLVRVGGAVMSGAGLATDFLVPGSLQPEWMKSLNIDARHHGVDKRFMRFLSGSGNPFLVKALEVATQQSFFRGREINPISSEVVEIPWLGGYITDKKTAFILATMPVYQTLARFFQATDALGREVPVEERLQRLLTGMPRIAQGEFGGRFNLDIGTARKRSMAEVKKDINTLTRDRNQLIRTGRYGASQEARITELMELYFKKLRRRGESKPNP